LEIKHLGSHRFKDITHYGIDPYLLLSEIEETDSDKINVLLLIYKKQG
jgi:hypothetical protein